VQACLDLFFSGACGGVLLAFSAFLAYWASHNYLWIKARLLGSEFSHVINIGGNPCPKKVAII
jgi:hypothetical protein